MLGYVFVGIAFGLLVQRSGLGFIWAALISLLVYAGSMQFVMVSFLPGGFGLFEIALITLLVNMRHMVYGLTFIEKFKNMNPLKKFYSIFSLTDETYALLCSARIPKDIPSRDFYLAVALLDQSYWIAGTVIGALFGTLIPFDSTGIEFTMTALFAVICTEQWLTFPTRIPAFIGAGCALACLLAFGPSNMMLPAMVAIIAVISFARPALERVLLRREPGKCS